MDVDKRVWTIEELDRVWPLPGGWVWHCEEGMDWFALHTPSMVMVFVDSDGLLVIAAKAEPIAVVLAVIGAHQGRDSVETLVEAMRDVAKDWRGESKACDAAGNRDDAIFAEGSATEATECALLLWRGTVAK